MGSGSSRKTIKGLLPGPRRLPCLAVASTREPTRTWATDSLQWRRWELPSTAINQASHNRPHISAFAVRLLRVAATLIANSPRRAGSGDRPATFRGMTMLKVFITAGCLCAANAAGAQTAGLNGQEIRDLIAGAAV